MRNDTYTLYIRRECPFCKKVLDFMNKEDIALPTMDITEWPNAENDLVNLGGKLQVPCLDINGHALYESDDIIAYLKEHKAELTSEH